MTVYGGTPSRAQLNSAEAFVQTTAALLGVPTPRNIRYTWNEGITDPLGCAGGGVTNPITSDVFAGEFPHYHELVHSIALPLGLPPHFFIEGLAEAFSPRPDFLCPQPVRGPFATPIEWLDSRVLRGAYGVERGRLDHELYIHAGVFTRTMLREFGRERYLRLYRSLTYFADLAEVRRAFVAVLGITIEEALALARNANTSEL